MLRELRLLVCVRARLLESQFIELLLLHPPWLIHHRLRLGCSVVWRSEAAEAKAPEIIGATGPATGPTTGAATAAAMAAAHRRARGLSSRRTPSKNAAQGTRFAIHQVSASKMFISIIQTGRQAGNPHCREGDMRGRSPS